MNFYPRSPCGERLFGFTWLASRTYFYPRSPCGERLNSAYGALDGASISIHALLAESDITGLGVGLYLVTISIHALLAESDAETAKTSNADTRFLSTLSLRRATCYSLRHSAQGRHFYPRTPCGERPKCSPVSVFTRPISIHALLAESDREIAKFSVSGSVFLSTLSLRRATHQTYQ